MDLILSTLPASAALQFHCSSLRFRMLQPLAFRSHLRTGGGNDLSALNEIYLAKRRQWSALVNRSSYFTKMSFFTAVKPPDLSVFRESIRQKYTPLLTWEAFHTSGYLPTTWSPFTNVATARPRIS